ncbi:amidohydrolase family protein [Cohnella sp. GCM10027633]|uniref:amidohydrolase family protein n=1 Tax=unclassified Cohnella TaxID=2636738 RepID=UPI0036440708
MSKVRYRNGIAGGALAGLILLTGCDGNAATPANVVMETSTPAASPAIEPSASEPVASAEPSSAAPERKSLAQLVEQFHTYKLTDVHNHDASGFAYLRMMSVWDREAIDRVVLFGDVSEPSAVQSDAAAWAAYLMRPDLIVPYFSGFDLHDESSLDVVRDNLESGYFGIGETVGASTNSPVVSQVAWKAFDPMDGYLPRIYELCAAYKAPILLHIDPLFGEPVEKLKEALDAYPDTTFILGHINAYTSPDDVDALMEGHPNLYGDFFAGFTDINFDSAYTLEDFIPVLKKYPDRFLLSTDSGYGLPSEQAAIESMYRTLDLLDDPDITRRIAHGNYDAILQAQPATKTQLAAIGKLSFAEGERPDLAKLTKLEAGRMLAEAGIDLTISVREDDEE